MQPVFISYRRQDSGYVAASIADRLRRQFGSDSVFMDVDNIPLGSDFRQHINTVISQCSVVLVLIADDWLEGIPGQRRLDQPADFVRLEVQTALERNIPVVPVLIENAEMPSPEELPEPIVELAFRNAAEVRSGRDLSNHLDALCRGLRPLIEQSSLTQSRSRNKHVAASSDPGNAPKADFQPLAIAGNAVNASWNWVLALIAWFVDQLRRCLKNTARVCLASGRSITGGSRRLWTFVATGWHSLVVVGVRWVRRLGRGLGAAIAGIAKVTRQSLVLLRYPTVRSIATSWMRPLVLAPLGVVLLLAVATTGGVIWWDTLQSYFDSQRTVVDTRTATPGKSTLTPTKASTTTRADNTPTPATASEQTHANNSEQFSERTPDVTDRFTRVADDQSDSTREEGGTRFVRGAVNSLARAAFGENLFDNRESDAHEIPEPAAIGGAWEDDLLGMLSTGTTESTTVTQSIDLGDREIVCRKSPTKVEVKIVTHQGNESTTQRYVAGNIEDLKKRYPEIYQECARLLPDFEKTNFGEPGQMMFAGGTTYPQTSFGSAGPFITPQSTQPLKIPTETLEAMKRAKVRWAEETHGADAPETAYAIYELAYFLASAQRDYEGAKALMPRVVEIYRDEKTPENPNFALALAFYADVRGRLKDPNEQVASLYAESVEEFLKLQVAAGKANEHQQRTVNDFIRVMANDDLPYAEIKTALEECGMPEAMAEQSIEQYNVWVRARVAEKKELAEGSETK